MLSDTREQVCSRIDSCVTHLLWEMLKDAIEDVLDSVTLRFMSKQRKCSHKIITCTTFSHGGNENMTDAKEKQIYLDNAATTQMKPEVLEAILPFMIDKFGNPSSIHSFGRETRSVIDRAVRRLPN